MEFGFTVSNFEYLITSVFYFFDAKKKRQKSKKQKNIQKNP